MIAMCFVASLIFMGMYLIFVHGPVFLVGPFDLLTRPVCQFLKNGLGVTLGPITPGFLLSGKAYMSF